MPETAHAPDLPRRNGEVSFWHAALGGMAPPRAPLGGDARVDVAIVGAGYTGLWTALYLLRASPGLRVGLIEAERAGFGASGRNGGWLSGDFAWKPERYLTNGSAADVRRLIGELARSVPEVIARARELGIDADIRETEELRVATNPAQLGRLDAEMEGRAAWGAPEMPARRLDAAEMAGRVAVAGALGGIAVGGVARIQPAKLVRGLAAAVEAAGAPIWEGTRALALSPGRVVTDRGTVTAGVVLRATEGFPARLPGHRRDWLPLNSAQIVTDPLPPDLWAEIGWQGYELLHDAANSYFYAQRTEDGRIAFGARGVPYRFASGIDAGGAADGVTVARLIAGLHRILPQLRAVPIAHAWCGVLGVPRDWCARVGFDPRSRMGWAGGYVGIGVATSNLAGRTLADLALGRQSALAALPWVNLPVRRWEPEPLRFLALRGMYRLLDAADARERAGGTAGALARIGLRLAGR